jgi:signal transduction histidine kinase
VLVGEVPAAVVFADEDRIAQVFANLISNAAKFSTPGEAVDISVTVGAIGCE